MKEIKNLFRVCL